MSSHSDQQKTLLHRPGSDSTELQRDTTHEKWPQVTTNMESSQQQEEKSAVPSCMSMKSDLESMDGRIVFKNERPAFDPVVDQQSSDVPSDQSAQQHQTDLDPIFMLLEKEIVTFVKNELKKLQKVLSPDYPECLESQREDEEMLNGEDEEQKRSSREAFLKITLHFLRRMKQEELAATLQSSKRILTDLA
ncbi:hypothetical protein EPR50_G00104540 [Perca flavescens]|uniref:Uncharacterized protein n=1 Tax=Perca flavescens TaxID=8167 RepID=A0A484CWG9_PERFV|nr:hypothetical protein EPR50_G00104540 [Perca flavescens]